MVVKAFETITLARVDDGTQGTPGKPGADGKTPYFHIAYANSSDSERNMNNWVLSDPAKQAAKITYKDGVNTIDYKGVGYYEVFNFPVKAKKGQSFTFSFSWTQPDVKSPYGSGNGATVSIADAPITGTKIGRNVIYLGVSKTNSKLFMISDTATADETYVSINLGFLADGIQYQFKASFQQDFSQDPDNHVYMGTYTDFTQADSLDPTAYSWTRVKGDSGADGKPGKDGVGIKSTLIQYASNTSGTVAPTTGWATTIPAASPGHYVWTKYTWTYTDNTTESGYSVGKIGETGQKGDQGPKGDPGSKDVPVITSGTTYPSNPKSGDMHWMTNSSGVVTGYYKFNGSQWVVQKVDAQALNVSSLSALSANLGTVTAGTLNAVKLIGAEFNTSNTFTDPNNATKKVTNTQLINKDGYKMVVQRNWFDTDIVLETTIDTMGIIHTSFYNKADFDASKAASSKIVIDPLNSNISISNTNNSVLLNGDGLYLYDATNSKGVKLKRISGGFQVLASPKTGGGLEDAVLDLKGNKSGINFHVGTRDDIPYDGQIYVEGRYGSSPKTNRSKMHLFGNSVVLHCFDAAEVRGGDSLTAPFKAIRASAFNVSSNPVFKTNIKGYTGGLALVNETDVYRYALKDELKNDKYSDHIGMMLDNVPSEIVGDSEGVDLYSAISVAWSAIKELSDKVNEQGEEIKKLKELAGGESSVEAN